MILDENSKSILQKFQDAYYQQIGTKMSIGSEEFALSSVFAYVLSVISGIYNKAYDNRFIETAQGIYLDNIAKSYGLSRLMTRFSNPYFEGSFSFKVPDGTKYKAHECSLIIAGREYRNKDAFTTGLFSLIRFVCVVDHSEALNNTELVNAVKSNGIINSCSIIGGLQSVATYLSDDETFREYILENRYIYNPGLASTYESIVKASSDYIDDAYCIRQDDNEYTPGNVLIYVKPASLTVRTLVQSIDIPYAYEVIDKCNVTTVGTKKIEIQIGNPLERIINLPYVYISDKYSIEEATELFAIKAKCTQNVLNSRIKFHDVLMGSDILNVLLNEDISLEDSGLSEDEYARIADFKILGVGGTIPGYLKPATPSSYTHISNITGNIALRNEG